MKRIISFVIALGALAGSLGAVEIEATSTIKRGMVFPDRTGFDVMRPEEQVLVSPSELFKVPGTKAVFVAFFQTTCASCVLEIGQLHAKVAQLQHRGIQVLLVGVKEDPSVLRKFMQKRQWNFPVLADRYEGDYSRKCGVFNANDELEIPMGALLTQNRKGDLILKAAWRGAESDIVGKILEVAP